MNTKALYNWGLLVVCCIFLVNTTWNRAPLYSRLNQDYALFFAVDTYEHMDKLANPVQNAQAIAAELRDNFGFQAELVTNPTLDDIDDKLDEYERKFNDGTFDQQGQLFVYFSGHGVAVGGNGYFMTRNADPNRPQRTAMEYDFYRNKINNFACQHIMVAIDACHSATFDPLFGTRTNRRFDRPGEQSFDRILANHQSYRSRVFWTSDAEGNETPDRSTFAFQLLQGLRAHQSNTSYLRSRELYTLYLEQAAPRPGGGSFGNDEPNSCFLFFKKARINIGDVRADRAAYQAVVQTHTLEAYRQYLRDYPNGDFRSLAQSKVAALEAEERELIAWSRAKQQNTPAAYETFTQEYPNSIYAPVALQISREPISSQSRVGGGSSDGFVRIEGGTFMMGCQNGRDSTCDDDEKPAHQVTLSTFYISPYEVTQAQWRQVMGNDPPDLHNKGCDQCPVEAVSWNEVQEFIQKLNAQTGQIYRLPTEAEWEYAARGGSQSKGYLYSGSNDIDEVAWYGNNARSGNTHGAEKTTRPIGTKKANELGLYDMSGNVWEWCADDWHDDYTGAPTGSSAWINRPRGSARVLRGGRWNGYPRYCRAAIRGGHDPSLRYNYLGFRLARSF